MSTWQTNPRLRIAVEAAIHETANVSQWLLLERYGLAVERPGGTQLALHVVDEYWQSKVGSISQGAARWLLQNTQEAPCAG